MKKGWGGCREIMEISQKINNQQDDNTVPETSNINKQNSASEMNHQHRKMETTHTKHHATKQPKTNTIKR